MAIKKPRVNITQAVSCLVFKTVDCKETIGKFTKSCSRRSLRTNQGTTRNTLTAMFYNELQMMGIGHPTRSLALTG